MEIKVNKEIREYSESIFFGLNLRQLIFSLLAMGAAIALYFFCREPLGMEVTSWLCIIGAVPFAVLGFVRYNGMSAEQLIVAWVQSELLLPERFLYNGENYYADIILEGESK